MTKPVNEHPSRNEDEYFARQDADLIKQMRAKLDQDRDAAERKSHFMKCPKCGGTLREEAHGHVKIDVCPDCKGMWLDAGEMDLMHQVHKSGGQGLFKGLLDLFPNRSASRK